MGLIGSSKGEILRIVLEKLRDGDTGSTAAGAVFLLIIGKILDSGVNFGDLFSHDQAKQAQAIGLVAGAAAVGIWSYFVGKRKKQP